MSISCGDLQGVKRVINRGTKYKFNRVSLLEEEVKTLERNIECTTHRFKEIEKSLEISKAELAPVEESSNKDTHKLTEKIEVAETNSEKNVGGNSVIALKEKLSADIHEFIDMNSPPARVLRTSRALCLLLFQKIRVESIENRKTRHRVLRSRRLHMRQIHHELFTFTQRCLIWGLALQLLYSSKSALMRASLPTWAGNRLRIAFHAMSRPYYSII